MTSPLTETLMRELRISERELNTFIATAPNRYKLYTIPKRTGGRREIAHPAAELKVAQRIVIERVLSALPVHHSATAYKKGSSIRRNAESHAQNRAILKYDFEDFFPSITENAWLAYCQNNLLFDRRDSIILARIMFRRPRGGKILRLSIGAPSSPILSNILMNEFDSEIFARVSKHKITYTRYADDMTFSSERTWNLREVNGILRSTISKMTSPKLIINEKKTVFVTPKYHRQVTGLVLTLDGKVSLGRDRKRMLRSAIHHYALGRLAIAEQVKLAGMLAFANDAEPEFYARMENIYGMEVMERLKRSIAGYTKTA